MMFLRTTVLIYLLVALLAVSGGARVSIKGTQFFIDNKITNYRSNAAGLLINSRMTQAIFDDENSATAGEWRYPDTHTWNATRNTMEFVSNMSQYSSRGLNAITVGMQGSPPDSSGRNNQACVVTGFTNSGQLKPAWAQRLQEVVQAADQHQMVVILNLFDLNQEGRLNGGDDTILSAVENIVQFLVQQGAENVIFDLADACSNAYTHQLLTPNSIFNLIRLVQKISNFSVSTSFPTGTIPPDSVIETADFLLLHSSGLNGTGLNQMIHTIHNTASYRRRPIPIVINQDSPNVGNLVQSVYAGVSWGYYSQGLNNYKDGYCSPPVDWAIDTVDKRAFFSEVTLLTSQ